MTIALEAIRIPEISDKELLAKSQELEVIIYQKNKSNFLYWGLVLGA